MPNTIEAHEIEECMEFRHPETGERLTCQDKVRLVSYGDYVTYTEILTRCGKLLRFRYTQELEVA